MERSVIIILVLLWSQDKASSMHLVELRVPAHAPIGGEALLGCQYELSDKDSLYSVKWYKDSREFFRYVAKDSPQAMDFSTTGIMVDVGRSSNNLVVLMHLTKYSTGTYRCEVSGEAPYFQTVSAESIMTTYLLPEEGPKLTAIEKVYKVGDRVSVNCTSFGSNPDTELKWRINDAAAPDELVRGPWLRASTREEAIDTLLNLDFIINPKHFRLGVLKLECQATLAPLYHEHVVHKIYHPRSSLYNQDVNGETKTSTPKPSLATAEITSKTNEDNNAETMKKSMSVLSSLILILILL